MSLRDEKSWESEEDFSDITEFRPERDAFRGKGPVLMEEDRTLSGVQRPWVIALIIGIALLFAGGAVFCFSAFSGHPETQVKEASSLIPESRIRTDTGTESSETELPTATIPGKTKASELSAETEGSGEESFSGETENSAEETEAEEYQAETELPEDGPEDAESAAPDGYEADGFRYAFGNGEATLLRYTGSEAAVILPEKVEGYPLAGVDDEAFKDCLSLEVLELSSSVCWIGARAFSGCVNLSEIYIPSGVNAISEEAFEGAEHAVIVAPAGSYAANYAARKGISYKPW